LPWATGFKASTRSAPIYSSRFRQRNHSWLQRMMQLKYLDNVSSSRSPLVTFLEHTFFRYLLIEATCPHAEIVRPFFRAVRNCNRIVSQCNTFGRRTLQLLKGSYFLLLALHAHSNIVRPVLGALFLDKRQIFLPDAWVDRSRAGFLEHAHLLLNTGCLHTRIMRPVTGAGFLDHYFGIIESRTIVRP
jgi:hypothetical protein